MDKPETITYKTTIPEVKRTLRLADKDKILFLEGEKKIIIVCSVPKSHRHLLFP